MYKLRCPRCGNVDKVEADASVRLKPAWLVHECGRCEHFGTAEDFLYSIEMAPEQPRTRSLFWLGMLMAIALSILFLCAVATALPPKDDTGRTEDGYGMDLPINPFEEGYPDPKKPDRIPQEFINPPDPPPPPKTTFFYGEELDAEEGVLYLIDLSGSMRRKRIESAKRETVKSIRGLQEGTRFNVHGWKSIGAALVMVSLWSDPRPADKGTKAEATAFIGGLHPSGGTPTGPAVQAALLMDNAGTVILLSDGRPAHPSIDVHLSMIVNACKAEPAKCHTFAIDSYGNFREFMRQVAMQTGGIHKDVSIP